MTAAGDHRTRLAFAYEDGESARRVERSLRPEVGAIRGPRTAVALARDGERVELTVEATDLAALRAGINSWLRLVGVAEDAGDATPV